MKALRVAAPHLLAEGAAVDEQVGGVSGGGGAERRLQGVPLLVLLLAEPGGVAVALGDVPAVPVTPAGARPGPVAVPPRCRRHAAAARPVRRRRHYAREEAPPSREGAVPAPGAARPPSPQRRVEGA